MTASKGADTDAIESIAKEVKEVSQVVRFDSLILLTYTAEAVNRYLGQWLKKYGQDQTRINILYLLIGNGGSLTPTNISKGVNRSKHAITRAIDILENDALVRREPSANDRRSLNVVITTQGIDIVKKTLPALQRASSIATSCLSEEQIDELKTITTKLRKWIWSSMPED
ncbi:MAG: MarR family transcriptional regulator [Syntrophaceae bacterium]|nr:MarR family transcriptional regulator [Syntrophaceae bacterium]